MVIGYVRQNFIEDGKKIDQKQGVRFVGVIEAPEPRRETTQQVIEIEKTVFIVLINKGIDQRVM